MLTTDDIHQIGQMLDERLDAKLDEKLAPIKTDIAGLKIDVSTLKSDVAGLKTDVTTIQTTLIAQGIVVRAIKKTVDLIARLLDAEQMRQTKRIARIEDRLGLPPTH